MSLITYEEVRPWARHQAAHRHRTPRWRDAAVVHGEEHRHPELNGSIRPSRDLEVAKIAKWADTGAVRGNPPADMPPPKAAVDDDRVVGALARPT